MTCNYEQRKYYMLEKDILNDDFSSLPPIAAKKNTDLRRSNNKALSDVSVLWN